MHETIPLFSTGMDASCYSSDEARSTVQKHILDEVETLQGWISALKARHYSLNLIGRLPLELLEKIFKWLPLLYNFEDEDDFGTRTGYVKVSFVCRYWRATALRCPELWTVIQGPVSDDYLETYLPRSGSLPLSVHPYGLGRLCCLLGELHRIRELDLSRTCKYSEVFPLLTAPAPLLETLTLDPHKKRSVVRLPTNLFAKTASRLREIRLTGCMIHSDLSASAFPNLTTLSLTALHYLDGPPLRYLLEALHGVPNLEDLSLFDAFEFMTGQDYENDGDQVEFPRLKLLRIRSATVPHVLALYGRIVHPITSRVLVAPQIINYQMDSWLDEDYHHDNYYADPLRQLGTLITGKITIGCLRITGKSDEPFLEFSDLVHKEIDVTIPGHGESVDGVITLQVPHAGVSKVTKDTLLTQLFEEMHLQSLKSLTADINLELEKETWLSMFGRLPLLSTIRIIHDGEYVGSLLHSIGAELPNDVIEGSRLSFPCLHTLTIQGWEFNPDFLSNLDASLTARLTLGAKLPVLRIVEEKPKFKPRSGLINAQEVVDRVRHLVTVVERNSPLEIDTLSRSNYQECFNYSDRFSTYDDYDTDSSCDTY